MTTDIRCKKCGSIDVKKNGLTRGGRQQYHCKACGVYTTTDAWALEWASKLAQVDELHGEGFSQHAIAHITGVSRPTIIAHLRKGGARHR